MHVHGFWYLRVSVGQRFALDVDTLVLSVVSTREEFIGEVLTTNERRALGLLLFRHSYFHLVEKLLVSTSHKPMNSIEVSSASLD